MFQSAVPAPFPDTARMAGNVTGSIVNNLPVGVYRASTADRLFVRSERQIRFVNKRIVRFFRIKAIFAVHQSICFSSRGFEYVNNIIK